MLIEANYCLMKNIYFVSRIVRLPAVVAFVEHSSFTLIMDLIILKGQTHENERGGKQRLKKIKVSLVVSCMCTIKVASNFR